MSDDERKRLSDIYSAMSDEELGQIAKSGDELSAAAQETLRSEITRRSLPLAISPPSVDVPELSDTVTVRQFRDLPEALLAKGSLDSAGIKTYLVDDNMVRMDWFISNLLGGIKLKVHSTDLQVTQEILNQPIPDTVEVEGVGEYEQPKCPHCHSLDIAFQELDKTLSYGSAFCGIPIPVPKKAWTCHACGHEWKGDDTFSGGPEGTSP